MWSVQLGLGSTAHPVHRRRSTHGTHELHNHLLGRLAPGGGLLAQAWNGGPNADTESREPLSVTEHGASEGFRRALLPPPPATRASSVESWLLNVARCTFGTERSSLQTEKSVR